ncbi:hypothetical protein K7432_001584 [Basidiobolus ranarum]|uniref:MIT domain-containing protein n=1 Tax=Basidiobolus ranarum TaxID=34480 RepID=A0ABR2W9I7_9FUNG
MAASTKTATPTSLPQNQLNTSPKTLLTIALSRAQDAVQLDSQKKLDEAIMAYQEAADLLSQVMDRAENANNRKKLRQIHQTYTNRIFLLNNSKNSIPNSPGLSSAYNQITNIPPSFQALETRNEENQADSQASPNIHNLRKKMSAPLLRTPNRTHFVTEENSRFSTYTQVPAGFQLELPPSAHAADAKQALNGYLPAQENTPKKPPSVPDSPLSHLLPPTSARLTALSKQFPGSSSTQNEARENGRMRGGSFSERTLPSLERMRERKEAFGHPILRKQLSSSALQQDSLRSKFQPKLSVIISNSENTSAQNAPTDLKTHRSSRSRGYSLSELNQRESFRQTLGNLPPPPFPPPGLSPNVVLLSEQSNDLIIPDESNTSPKSSTWLNQKQEANNEYLKSDPSVGAHRDSKVDVDLDDDEHLQYYITSDNPRLMQSLQKPYPTGQPISVRNENPNEFDSLLPLRSSSLPRKLGAGPVKTHRPLPLDISKIDADYDKSMDSSKGQKFPPALKRLGSDQNLNGEFALEPPRSATFKPPTPKFPPPEAIRPFDTKNVAKETNNIDEQFTVDESDSQLSLLSSAKAVFNREPPPPLSVITYRPSATPPPGTAPILRDRPGANGGSIQLASMAALKAENTQKKGSLTADHLASRTSILAPNFRRKMSLPMGLGASNMMRSAVQNTNSSLMPKSHNGSNINLSADPSPTGSYFTNPNRRPHKGLTLFDIVLEEPQEGTSLFEDPPQKPELQPFWLMRCFERSMMNGGFISARMYIPRSLWYQSGARLSAIEAKISACELITATLYNMVLSLGQIIPNTNTPSVTNMKEVDITMLLKELESFDTVLYSVQNNLAKKLSFIESIKKSQSSFLSLGNRITKSLERMTTSRDKIDDVSLYIDVLIKLFQTCQVIGNIPSASSYSLTTSSEILWPSIF